MALFYFEQHILYVRLHENKIEINDITQKKEVFGVPGKAFTNERLLIADFREAAMLMKTLIKELYRGALLRPAFIAVVQPLAKTEGGISETEKRILRDLMEHGGAKKTILLEDDKLYSREEIKNRVDRR